MNIKGIEDIYIMLINGLELTDITLENNRFTKEDINTLIINKQIRITNDNKYSLVSVKKFFAYGVTLLRNRNISSANACFYKCYELDKHIKEVCLQVLTLELKRQKEKKDKNYKEAFNIFINLESIQKRKYENNNDLYLYLFSFILEDMPNNYKERVSKIKENDLKLDNVPNNKDENEIRDTILKRKFKYSIELLDNLIKKQNNYPVRYELLRSLLNEVVDAEIKYNNNLLYLVKNNKYEEIIRILENRKKLVRLSTKEENILFLTNVIIEIVRNNNIPLVLESNTNNLNKAIINNDFKLAYILTNNYIEKYNINKDNNIIYLLLVKVNEIISKIDRVDTNNKEIIDIEDIAYYISSSNIDIDEAKRKLGLTIKTYLLIKLIYARDYYIEGKYLEGDKLLSEVERNKGNYKEVNDFIDQLKRNKYKYIEELEIYVKSRTKKI